MPGLMGFTHRRMDPDRARRVVCEMAALATDTEASGWDEPFLDEAICATRTHLGILQPAPQPFASAGLRVWVEGEVFNGDDLAAPASNDAGQDQGLPALLAGVCARGGHRGDWSALASLDGIYSAVLYDEVRGTVHVIVDRLGMRYIHWTVVDGCFAWATSSNAFLALPGFAARVPSRRVAQFLGIGTLVLDGTWMEGVELVSPGTVLSWDCQRGSLSRYRYWWWDRIKRVDAKIDRRAAAEELAYRFRRSVEKRWSAGGKAGLSLSGGLDSRAILAALPTTERSPVTVTFGLPDSLDARAARRVAAIRGAEAHFIEISARNWLRPRSDGVWWTEGNTNIVDLHGSEARPIYEKLMEVNLDGYGGDTLLRGDLLQGRRSMRGFDPGYIAGYKHCDVSLLDGLDQFAPLGRSEYWFLEASARRWVAGPLLWELTFLENRKPFLANEIVEFVLSLPDDLRYRGRLYTAMLVGAFPEYFKRIAWANTGIPIGWPRGPGRVYKLGRRLELRLTGGATAPGVPGRGPVGYTDYPRWLRAEPARTLVDELLLSPAALYRVYDDSGRAATAWEAHLAGADHANELGRYMTVELRLRQLLAGTHRPQLPAPTTFARARRPPDRPSTSAEGL